MDPVLNHIDRALRLKNLSDAAASKLAVGNYSLIKNMRTSRGDDKRYNFQALKRLAEVLDLELYFGPPRDTGPIETVILDGDDYAHIPLHDALLAAGAGAENPDESIIDHLAIRKDWLAKVCVPPSAARLARVHGDSMEPTMWDGDMVMINTASPAPQPRARAAQDRRRAPVYALIDNGEARIKRIERPSDDSMLLISDNPDYLPELRQGKDIQAIQIIGKVVWWGHTAKE